MNDPKSREHRLRAALRENLKRRKAQTRERAKPSTEDTTNRPPFSAGQIVDGDSVSSQWSDSDDSDLSGGRSR